jgi:hypothetical protein
MPTNKELAKQILDELRATQVDKALYKRAVELAGGDRTEARLIYVRSLANHLKALMEVATSQRTLPEHVDQGHSVRSCSYVKAANFFLHHAWAAALVIGAGIAAAILRGSMMAQGAVLRQEILTILQASFLYGLSGFITFKLFGKGMCAVGSVLFLMRTAGVVEALSISVLRFFALGACECPKAVADGGRPISRGIGYTAIGLAVVGACAGAYLAFRATAQDYARDAVRYMNSNDASSAEKVLREGLGRFPDDWQLQQELLDLYRNTKKWKDLRSYLDVAKFSGEQWESAAPMYWAALGGHYLAVRDWLAANEAYARAGSLQIDHSYRRYNVAAGRCLAGFMLAGEYLSNAATAAFNAHNDSLVRNAYNELTLITECQDHAEFQRYLTRVERWMRPRDSG